MRRRARRGSSSMYNLYGRGLTTEACEVSLLLLFRQYLMKSLGTIPDTSQLGDQPPRNNEALEGLCRHGSLPAPCAASLRRSSDKRTQSLIYWISSARINCDRIFLGLGMGWTGKTGWMRRATSSCPTSPSLKSLPSCPRVVFVFGHAVGR